MANGRFVSYLRVSTDRQGRSGLGLEAQRADVERYLNGGNWKLIAEFVEVESGSKDSRPKLAEALALCRAYRATLLVAKLDHLARDAHFLLGLQKAGIDFIAVDMPDANRMTVGILAMVAEGERKMISARTKAALAAARAKGTKLGGHRTYKGTETPVVGSAATAAIARAARTEKATAQALAVAPIIHRMDPDGTASLRTIAAKMMAEGVPAPGGGETWTAATVARLRARLAAVSPPIAA